MARSELTPQEIINRKVISANINRLIAIKNITQAELSSRTKIPRSTLTGYVKGTSTPNPGNIQKLADFFNVLKSDIDPRFSSYKNPTLELQRPKLQKIIKKVSKLDDSELDKLNQVIDAVFGDKIDENKKEIINLSPNALAAHADNIDQTYSNKDIKKRTDFLEEEIKKYNRKNGK